MDAESGLKLKSASDIEGDFLVAMEEQPLPVEKLLALLSEVDEDGADTQAQLFQEALLAAEDRGTLLRLLAQRAAWRPGDVEFGREIRKVVREVFKDRNSHALIDSASLGEVGCAEATKRLCVLLSLKPGVLVHDSTWGYGEVRRLDDFYQKVTIDFSRKRGHQLSFAYAGETLDVLSENHILALMYRDPDAVRTMVEKQPGEVVKLALQSFGPLSANRLEDVLAQDVLRRKPWKSFWEAARKQLKNDPLVEIPSRRTEPITLLTSEKSYDDAWASKFSDLRDASTILALMTELEEAGSGTVTEQGFAVIAERCAFAIHGMSRNPALMTRLAMQAMRLGLDPEAAGLEEARRHLQDHSALIKASLTLPVKQIRALLEFLMSSSDLFGLGLVDLLQRMPSSLINEALPLLLASEASDQADARIRACFASRSASPQMVTWACRNVETAVDGGMVPMADLFLLAIAVLETSDGGDVLKMRNQIARLFEKQSWVKSALKRMSREEQRMVVERLQRMQGWDSSSKRSLIGRIIKLKPELTEQVAEQQPVEEDPFAGRYTSWRSLRERSEALKKLVESDIPANSKDIAHARSYGDLRENFEYQAAKDQQRLLLRRQAEIENDLMHVKGSDFKGFPSDKVGMGTVVTVQPENGDSRTYVILGEWDRDESLAIISSRSALALALMGKRVGDPVKLPGENGPTDATITAVEPPNDEIREWIGVS